MISLNVVSRDTKKKLETLRKEGFLPAVFYGKKEKSTPISVKLTDFSKVWKEAGETTVISLKGAGDDVEALIHDIQYDPVTEVPQHVDFYVFEKGHKIKLDIPIEFEGTSPAVKDLGGILIKVLHDVKIEALPKDLPRELKVDIAPLVNFESQILAKDIPLPNGVTLVTSPDEVVALVSEAKEEVIEETPVDLSAIEVEKKGKKEEEGTSTTEGAEAKPKAE